MRSHYVYRCFDAEGLLLYVGCASNVKRRMSHHARGTARASRTLSALMASYTTEGPYSTRADAEAAEQSAIASEAPLLNIQHSGTPGWLNDRRLARYLEAHDLPLSVAGLHRCDECGILRGFHMPHGLCTDCRDGLITPTSRRSGPRDPSPAVPT